MRFCPDDCRFLSLTEEHQNNMKRVPRLPHMCYKVGGQVKHGIYHPKLVQSDECKKEILNRKFD